MATYKLLNIKSRSTASAWLFDTQTRQTPWTDNDSSLLFAALNLWPWPWPLTSKQGNREVKTRFWAFDLDFWLMTLTYNPKLANIDSNTKNTGRRSSGSAVRGRTDEHYQVHYLPRFAVDNYGLIGSLKGGVSVQCRSQIFYSVGCQLENHNVECRLGIINLSFTLQTRSFMFFFKLGVECWGTFWMSGVRHFCPQSDEKFWQWGVSESPLSLALLCSVAIFLIYHTFSVSGCMSETNKKSFIGYPYSIRHAGNLYERSSLPI